MKASVMLVSCGARRHWRSSFVVRMLAVAEGGVIELQPVACCLRRQRDHAIEPRQFRFKSVLPCRRQSRWRIETADRHRDSVAVEKAIGQRRPAFGAEAAFRNRRTREDFWLPPSPDKLIEA